MKQVLYPALGVLAGAGMVWAGVAIVVWDIGQLRLARASRDWPTVEGIVLRSEIDDRSLEKLPRVEYAYTVAGKAYTSRRISFDLNDKPGGQGRNESIVARYPQGERVTVYFNPNEPAAAVLEPGDYSPFFMPLLFAALFLGLGSNILWKVLAELRHGETVPRQAVSGRRPVAGIVCMSVVLYAMLVLTSFQSAARDVSEAAFGPRPAGMPNLLFVLVLQTLLYLPVPWFLWHAMALIGQALLDGRRPGIVYLLTVGRVHPHLRRSQAVCLVGLSYLFAIFGAWIVYATIRGV